MPPFFGLLSFTSLSGLLRFFFFNFTFYGPLWEGLSKIFKSKKKKNHSEVYFHRHKYMLYVCASALTPLPSQEMPQCSTLKISLFPDRLVWLGSRPFSKKEETFPLNAHGVGFSQHSLPPSVTWWMRVRLDVWPYSKGQHKPRFPLTPARATNNDFASVLVDYTLELDTETSYQVYTTPESVHHGNRP